MYPCIKWKVLKYAEIKHPLAICLEKENKKKPEENLKDAVSRIRLLIELQILFNSIARDQFDDYFFEIYYESNKDMYNSLVEVLYEDQMLLNSKYFNLLDDQYPLYKSCTFYNIYFKPRRIIKRLRRSDHLSNMKILKKRVLFI